VPPPEPSDRALVHAAIAGATEAFDALYRRHAPAAWRVAQAVSRNPDDAADAVAEAFTRVFQALPSGRLGSDLAFRPYLLAATRNAAIDGLRKAGRLRPTADVERLDQHALASGPSEGLVAGDDRQKVAEAFAALPERWRSVLWMTEVEELPAREVGKLLGLSANGVAQLAMRARAGLRDRYLQAHVPNHARPRCAFTADRLGAYVGGGLSSRDVTKVDRHLTGCSECRRRLAEVQDIGSTLRHLALPLPVVLGALARRQLRDSVVPAAGRVTRRVLPGAADGMRRAVGAAAGLTALVAGVGGMAFLDPATRAPRASERRDTRPATVAAAPTRGAAATSPPPAAVAGDAALAPGPASPVTLPALPVALPALPVALPAVPLPALPVALAAVPLPELPAVPLPALPVPLDARAGVPSVGAPALVGG
jgi:RNA polymerase sigma factor (sigma-70 family)